MFSRSAELYDLIYSGFKDYPAETARLVGIIRQLQPSARTVLDVACGTAEHARLLADTHGFDVDGIDLEPAFVAIAQRKLPRGSVIRADMISFKLGRRYDVILCLFSSIGYVRTLDNVRRAFARFREHLVDGGVLILEPWFEPGVLPPGGVVATTAESAEVSVARMSHCEIHGRISRLRFEYLIGRSRGIEHVVETHELGLFTTQEMLDCFRTAGLESTYDPDGLNDRGLFVARPARS